MSELGSCAGITESTITVAAPTVTSILVSTTTTATIEATATATATSCLNLVTWYQDTGYNNGNYEADPYLATYEACSAFGVCTNVPDSFKKMASSTIWQAASYCKLYDSRDCVASGGGSDTTINGGYWLLDKATEDPSGNEIYFKWNDLLVSYNCYE
jgi:hypothetical protein